MNTADYELIIIGGGPAGLTAGLYAARSRLKAVLLEKGVVGGQVLVTDWIDNYPGFPEGLSGFDLVEKMAAQAARFDLQTTMAPVESLDFSDPLKKIYLEGGKTLTAKTVIIATGARPKQLDIPGEQELTGKGVSYCATCDGPFYRDMEIAVVGGGNTAIQEAMHLTKFASKVTVIHRRDRLRSTQIVQEKAFANKKIEFLCDTTVIAVNGDKAVESLKLQNKDGSETELAVQGVFVLIGTLPNNSMFPEGQLVLEDGYIITDCEMRTNIPGVMAAGDIRSKEVRQVITAAGDGAVAAQSAEQYLRELTD
ncbi:MAG: thioredoxin-disulfide reductase [Proteobacteria bacterium]|nr:thioredoxin-disulfide reductase [Pseudomonadota bacterium]MBU1709372.1 thioredoxin-disulfide reductase [Pseudomonadota bacterium]